MRVKDSIYRLVFVAIVMMLLGINARAQLVISTSSRLKSAAEALAAHRLSHDSIRALIVYDITEPDSLRRLCQSLYKTDAGCELFHNADGIRYLTIFGKTPVWHLPYSDPENAAPCDDYYGWLDAKADTTNVNSMSRNTLCIGVGRIPAESLAEAHGIVNKIIEYDSNHRAGQWKGRICLLADNDQAGDNNTHMKHCETLADIINSQHPEFFVQKIYLPAYNYSAGSTGGSYPDADKEFNEALTSGCLVVNYAGHGSVTSITGEAMMNNQKAERLNMPYLPLWIAATCKVGWWDNNNSKSMCETLLSNPNGGAIGVICSTRDVYASSNLSLNKPIIENLFNRHPDGTRSRLGEVLTSSKNSLTDSNKLRFCLLGDASMTLAFPHYEAQIESINGQPVTDEAITLKALQPVTLEGSVNDTTFYGTAYITAYDSPVTLTTKQIEGSAIGSDYTFKAMRNKVFVGKSTIEKGRFKATFRLPESIKTSQDNTMLTLYAASLVTNSVSERLSTHETYLEAIGALHNIRYEASPGTEKLDTIAPQVVRLYLGDESFRDGDVVGSTPYFFAELWDESGFDVSGSVLGRDMTLSVVSLTDPVLANRQYVLNNYFTTMLNQSQRGAIGFLMPELPDGTYRATLRVCDICNNVSFALVNFTVNTSAAPKAIGITAFPSPAHSGETIHFRIVHNRPQSDATMRLQIFSQTGSRIYETTVNTSSAAYYQDPENETITGYSEIQYNGSLAPGFYIYRVYMNSGKSEDVSDAKIFMVTP